MTTSNPLVLRTECANLPEGEMTAARAREILGSHVHDQWADCVPRLAALAYREEEGVTAVPKVSL